MDHIALLILRVTVGAVFVGHGWPKIFGSADAAHGWSRTSQLLRSRGVPQPVLAAKILGAVEVLAGVLVIVGLLLRVAMIPLVIVVGGAIPMVKWKKGFIEGWDFPITLVAAGLALVILGGGDLSADALIFGKG